jgi:hypothetical protein
VLSDALGGRYTQGEEHVIPSGAVRKILDQRFPTRPSGNRASDLHFTPGATPIVVVCTPLFGEIDPAFRFSGISGACSGLVRVVVVNAGEGR